jgi:hypothetical protein
MESLGPFRLQDVDAAQRAMAEIADRLVAERKVKMPRRQAA